MQHLSMTLDNEINSDQIYWGLFLLERVVPVIVFVVKPAENPDVSFLFEIIK